MDLGDRTDSLQKALILLLFLADFGSAKTNSGRPNVGTVLFTDADTMKDCWSMESLALLTSRMVLEDLLPSKTVINLNDEGFVTDIIDYFRLILEVVRKMTYGKSKHVMLMALTDVLGGYLNHLVLPLAKYSYYAGNINYETVKKLYQLFDELKCFLRTNGKGWSKPIPQLDRRPNAKIIPRQPPSPRTDPCKGLIFYENVNTTGTNNVKDKGYCIGKEREMSNNNRKSNNVRIKRACDITIPMPFFDSKTHPCAIAVPFRTFSLRNVESKASVNLLIKYYVASYKCLASKNANPKTLSTFMNTLYAWIRSQVLPRLGDEKFYAAFGGVYRIVETLKAEGMVIGGKEIGNYNIMPETQIKGGEGGEGGAGEGDAVADKEEKEDQEGAKIKLHGEEDNTLPAVAACAHEDKKKSNLILIALLCTIFIWFLLGSMFICYRMRAAKEKKKSMKEIEPLKSYPSKCSSRCTLASCDHRLNKGKALFFTKSSKKTKSQSRSSTKCTAMCLRRKKTSSGITNTENTRNESSIKHTTDSDNSSRCSRFKRKHKSKSITGDSIMTAPTTDEDDDEATTPKDATSQGILKGKIGESSSKQSLSTSKRSSHSSRLDDDAAKIKFSQDGLPKPPSSQSISLCVKDSDSKSWKKDKPKSKLSCILPSKIPTPRKDSKTRGRSPTRAGTHPKRPCSISSCKLKKRSPSRESSNKTTPVEAKDKKTGPSSTCRNLFHPCKSSKTKQSPRNALKTVPTQASGHISEEVYTDDSGRGGNEDVQVIQCPAGSRDASKTPMPTKCACHSSISGVYTAETKMTKTPFVFGYDFETTSSDNTADPGADTSEGEDLVQANMSK